MSDINGRSQGNYVRSDILLRLHEVRFGSSNNRNDYNTIYSDNIAHARRFHWHVLPEGRSKKKKAGE